MFKTQEYLQNKHKNISLFQHQMLYFSFSSCPSPH